MQIAKSLGSRALQSVKGVKPLVNEMFGMVSTKPNAYAESQKAMKGLLDESGGITRPFGASMASSRQVGRKALEMPEADWGQVAGTAKADFKNIFNMGRGSDVSRWYSRLDDEARGAFDAARQSVQTGGATEDAFRNFSRKAFGQHLDDTGFEKAYQNFGSALDSPSAYRQDAWGRRLGAGIGAAGVLAPVASAPFTLSEHAGGAVGALNAKSKAMDGAMDGAAQQMYNLQSQPFLKRMQSAWNPNYTLQDMYAADPGRAGLAHHYMRGAGKQENIQAPGVTDYLREYLFPMVPGLGSAGNLQKSVEAQALKSFQKMSSYNSNYVLLSVPGLMCKEAGKTKVLTDLGRKAWGSGPVAAIRHKVTDLTEGVARRLKPTPSSIPSATSQPGAWANMRNNFTGVLKSGPLPAMMAGGTLVGMPMHFLGGKSTVEDGAYNSGYGAGMAGAADAYSNLPMWQRFGSALMPGIAEQQISQRYPDIYQRYMQLQAPAGLR